MVAISQSSTREIARRYALLTLVSVVLGFLFAIFVTYSETGHLPPLRDQFGKYSVTALCTVVISLVVFQIDSLLNRFISWRSNFLLRFFVGFLVNATIALALVFLASKYLIV